MIDDDIDVLKYMEKESRKAQLLNKLYNLFHIQKTTKLEARVVSVEERNNLDEYYDEIPDYKCGCRCNLKECNNICSTYFYLQDMKPYRKVDLNIPELEHYSIQEKRMWYEHFQKMLHKRNRNPYYFFKYLFAKINFEKHKRHLAKLKK